MPLDDDPHQGLSGWPRRLPGLLSGPLDEAEALAQVREAIRVERATLARPVELRVDVVEALDDEVAEEGGQLWRLQVAVEGGLSAVRDWEAATLRRELVDGGAPWRGEVVDADTARDRLVVLAPSGQQPTPGPARAHPFDFLQSALALAERPSLADARPAWARLLAAARGALRPTGPLLADALHPARRAHGHPAWTWPWAMVWGPPGTGKTHTLVVELRRILQDPGERVLVVSTTNRATDEVALRLGPQPGGVLRVGAARVAAFRERDLLALLPQPVARLDHLHALEADLSAARHPRDRLRARLGLARARRGLPRLPDLLAESAPRCILTTVHAALGAVVSAEMEDFLAHGRAPFTTVIVDEAGLVPRTSVAALALLAARQVVLVGDPRQLSPICVAARSMAPPVKRWLALSAMDEARPDDPATSALVHQHRMHPDICAVVSRFQYDGRLRDADDVRTRPLPTPLSGRLAAWPRAAWIVLDRCAGLDLSTAAAQRGPSRSWERPAGVEVLDRLLRRHPELGRLEGLFISPYRAQAHRADQLLAAHRLAPRWRASTVHAQQGAQADVVVFDLVRHGGWPLPEWKRLVNVALSRARHQLLVLACGPELDGQPGCAGLADTLRRCTVDADGALHVEVDPTAQQSLLGRLAARVEEPTSAPPPARERPPPTDDPADLGTQIHYSRAARRSLTRAQAQLIRRDLRDLGPRVVRGVAGSGKTIVLARWVAVELVRHPDRDATVVFGNSALRRHLERLIEQAWRVTVDDPAAEAPWDRVQLVHIGHLLQDLLRTAGLPAQLPGPDVYDYEAQARALRACDLAPRYGLLYLDEAQDLGHDTLALLVSLVHPDPADPTGGQVPVRVFYDNAQNVYGRTTPRWTEFGLDMRGRSTVLRESFRATRPGMELALATAHALRPIDQDPVLRELIAPAHGPPLLARLPGGRWRADFCVVQGQPPAVAVHASPDDEAEALVARVRDWLCQGVSPRDVRVLAPRRQRCEQLAAALRRAEIDAVHARNTSFDNEDPRIVVTTPQSFKGYEAELVAVVGVEGFVARPDVVLVDALYVALTRARTWMWVSGVRVPDDQPGARVIAAVLAAAAAAPPDGEELL